MYQLLNGNDVVAESPVEIVYDNSQQAWLLPGLTLADSGRLLTVREWPDSLDEAKARKFSEILTKSDEAMNSLTASYSDNEKLSWPKQEAEAKALLTAPDALAPLLRGIAAARGIPVEELRDKVLANVSVSEQATALILGTQQKYEDAVRAAETVEAVQGIEVVYSVG